MANEFKIFTRFKGIDDLSKTTKKIASNFGKVTRAAFKTNAMIGKVAGNVKKLGQNLRGASLAGIVGLTAILTPVVAFSDQINELEAVSQATTQQLAEMTSQAKELGSTTRFSASQAAGAQTFLARAGFDVNQILKATPDVLNLAAASNMELARTADIASNIMGAFKIEASDMGRVADVLAATTSAANVDLEQLAESLKFAAPVAKTAGLTLEETASAVGLLGNIGIQSTLAGTALRRMLGRLAAPSKSATKLLLQFGVSTKDTAGNLRKLPDILADVSKGLKTLPSGSRIAAINELFGLQGISPGAELIDQASLGNLDKLTQKLLNVEGRAKSMAETMNKGPGGAIRELKSAAEGLAISIGDSGLTGQFTKIVKSLTDFASQLSSAETQTLANVAIMLTFLAILAPILLTIGSIASAIGPMVAGLVLLGGVIQSVILPLIGKLIVQFAILAFANPFTLVVIAAWAIVAAFAAIIIWWDDIVDSIKTGVSKILEFISPLTDFIGSFAEIGSLFGKTVFGIGGDETEADSETGEKMSVPAQMAANQASASANAQASVEFVGTPETGVVVTGADGDEINPENGVTALAGLGL